MRTLTASRSIPQAALDYHAYCECAVQNSGNFYDFLPLIGSRLAISMGDLPPVEPSLTTPCLQALVRGLTAGSCGNVEKLARDLNGILYLLGLHDLCVPWFYASIDPVCHQMEYVNAGHESPWLIRRRRGTVHRLERTGTALGFSQHSIHGQRTIAVDEGDLLVMFSESLAETWSCAEMLRVVLENAEAGTAELTRRVFESAPVAEADRTFAAVRILGTQREPIVEARKECLMAYAA